MDYFWHYYSFLQSCEKPSEVLLLSIFYLKFNLNGLLAVVCVCVCVCVCVRAGVGGMGWDGMGGEEKVPIHK